MVFFRGIGVVFPFTPKHALSEIKKKRSDSCANKPNNSTLDPRDALNYVN